MEEWGGYLIIIILIRSGTAAADARCVAAVSNI
jgi:hypothetical protein